MKMVISIFIFCLSFSSCDLLIPKVDEDTEQPYTAKIVWDSGLFVNSTNSHTVYGNELYFYERPPGYTTINIYALTRLDAETGSFLWRSSIEFSNILMCQPIVIDGYVYVFLEPNIIYCFDRENGEHTATVHVSIDDNQGWELEGVPTAYQQYLYLSLWNLSLQNGTDMCFSRLNVQSIDHNGNPEAAQVLAPEIVWEPEMGLLVVTKPVVHNNVIYANTYGSERTPIELAGFDITTKEMVFYQTFGGPQDKNLPFPETGGWDSPLFIHNNVLYFISWSINAWDLKTGEALFRHVFSRSTPNAEMYGTGELMQAEYYKGKIYYRSAAHDDGDPNDFRNIHCIDPKTGTLIWNTIAKQSYTVHANLIIAHDRLYIPQRHGLRVYDPENGKLIGVDKSFYGTELGRNILYKDTMICVRMNPDTLDFWLVAVDIGK